MKKKKAIWILMILLLVYFVCPLVINEIYWNYSEIKDIDMNVIAHRGGASLAPENTLSCFKKGIESGADMLELDIHLTKDGHIVVCHDQTVDRTTNGKGKIRDLTLDEISKLCIIDSDGRITNEKIPTLQDVFSLVNDYRNSGCNVKLLVEIKRTHNIYQGIEEKLINMILNYDAKNWVVVQSFNDFAIEKIHSFAPDIRVEKLAFYKFPFIPFIVDGNHISYFSYKKYHYVSSFNFYYRIVTPSLINDIHSHKKEIKIWTIEDDFPQMDVDGIITNRPDLIKKKIK